MENTEVTIANETTEANAVETSVDISPSVNTSVNTSENVPTGGVLDIDAGKLKKKIYMVLLTAEAFSHLPKIGGEEGIKDTCEEAKKAKELFHTGSLVEAKNTISAAIGMLKECCAYLPKRARGGVLAQIAKIEKY
jgi:hypothetical protein